MTPLPEECCHALKNMADPLFLLSLTNQHTPSGEIIGNSLVLLLSFNLYLLWVDRSSLAHLPSFVCCQAKQ